MSFTKLGDQLRLELCRTPVDATATLFVLRRMVSAVSLPAAHVDLDACFLDVFPKLVVAARASKECQGAVQELLAVAVGHCNPREVFTALASVLDEASEHPARCPCLIEFQATLLHSLASILTRISRQWARFLEEYIAVALRWAQTTLSSQATDDGNKTVEAAFCNSCHLVTKFLTERAAQISCSDAAKVILKRALARFAGIAIQSPWRLHRGAVCIDEATTGGNSAFGTKLMLFRPAVLELFCGVERAAVLMAELDVSSRCAENQVGHEIEDVWYKDGNSALLCLSIFNADVSSALPLPSLDHLAAAVRTLFNAAALHNSPALALTPLVTLHRLSTHAGMAQMTFQDRDLPAALTILSTLVDVMAYNPVEIVRITTYEAFNSLFDAFAMHVRLGLLNEVLQMSPSTAQVVGLQRLRLEVARETGPSLLSPIAALKLSEPWIKHGNPPGWWNETDIVGNADVIAAALSVWRFVLLKQQALEKTTSRNKDGLEKIPTDKLKAVLENDLRPLHDCTSLLLQMQSAGLSNDTAAIHGNVALFLAVQRLEENLDQVISAATDLLIE